MVVSDIRLDDGDGFSLLKSVQEVDPFLPVILITGYGTLNSAIEAIRMGAFDFLSKPLLDHEILHAIERALSQKPHQKEAEGKGRSQQREALQSLQRG